MRYVRITFEKKDTCEAIAKVDSAGPVKGVRISDEFIVRHVVADSDEWEVEDVVEITLPEALEEMLSSETEEDIPLVEEGNDDE